MTRTSGLLSRMLLSCAGSSSGAQPCGAAKAVIGRERTSKKSKDRIEGCMGVLHLSCMLVASGRVDTLCLAQSAREEHERTATNADNSSCSPPIHDRPSR